MKRSIKITAVVLALLMAVSLFAGCNKNKSNGGSTTPSYIYNAEYNKLDIDAEEFYISYTAVSSDALYMIINVQDGTKTETYTYYDENNNLVEESYESPVYVNRMYKADLDGKNAAQLSDFAFDDSNTSTDSESRYKNISVMFVTGDGTPGIIRCESVTVFDIPADFDPETDNRWNYNSTSTQTYYYETFDKETGKLIESKKIAENVNGEGKGAEFFDIDKDGNNYVGDWSGITVYSSDFGTELFTTKDDTNLNGVCRMSDGRVAVCQWGESGMEYVTLDLAKGEFGDKITVPANAYNVMPGSGDYLLYNRSESGVTGIKANGVIEEVLNWVDSDIESDGISYLTPLENGDFICVNDTYDENKGHTTELVRLVRTPYDPNTERQVITMACMGIDYDVKTLVMDFNKKSTEYKIRMVDYSQYNTGDDYTAGVTKLNTEIVAGHVPDIFCINANMPISQYAGKDILEDLTPYMEKDFGKDAFVEEFFNTLRNDEGKLYEIYDNFTISTAAGLENVVGDGSSWTFADMKAAIEKLAEGATVLDNFYVRERAVQDFLYNSTSQFVDWETGKCTFDSAEFVDLLNFVKSFKTQEEVDSLYNEDYVYEEDYERINSGKQLLEPVNISDFTNYRAQTFYCLNGTPSFVGFPGSGSCFSEGYGSGFAISSKSQYKDAAWDFIKRILTADYQSANVYNGLPTNKAAFESKLTAEKTPIYIDPSDSDNDYGISVGALESSMASDAVAMPADTVDSSVRYSDFNKGSVNEQGWKEQEKTSLWHWDSDGEWYTPIFAMTDVEEQALRDLISSITVFKRDDNSLSTIIDEETQAFFSGQKSAEDTAKMIQSRATIYINEQK